MSLGEKGYDVVLAIGRQTGGLREREAFSISIHFLPNIDRFIWTDSLPQNTNIYVDMDDHGRKDHISK